MQLIANKIYVYVHIRARAITYNVVLQLELEPKCTACACAAAMAGAAPWPLVTENDAVEELLALERVSLAAEVLDRELDVIPAAAEECMNMPGVTDDAAYHMSSLSSSGIWPSPKFVRLSCWLIHVSAQCGKNDNRSSNLSNRLMRIMASNMGCDMRLRRRVFTNLTKLKARSGLAVLTAIVKAMVAQVTHSGHSRTANS